jgi:hypothetical protein
MDKATGAMGFDLVTGDYVVFITKAILIATGGLGQLFKLTTNTRTLTGDGIAMAWESGQGLSIWKWSSSSRLPSRTRSLGRVFLSECALCGDRASGFTITRESGS